MDKKVCLVFFSLLIHSAILFAHTSPESSASKWVDSVYNKLNNRERIAQLIIERVKITGGQTALYDEKIPSGGIIIQEGSDATVLAYLDSKHENASVPVYAFWDGSKSVGSLFGNADPFPEIRTLAAIRNHNTISNLYRAQAQQLQQIHLNGYVDEAPKITYKHGDLLLSHGPAYLEPHIARNLFENRSGSFADAEVSQMIQMKIDLFAEDILKYIPEDIYNDASWYKIRESQPLLVLNIQSEALLDIRSSKFQKLVIEKLLNSHLQYGGPVVADLSQYRGNYNVDEGLLIESGYHQVITEDPASTFNELYRAWKSNQIKSSDLEDRVKKVLTYKYNKGLRQKSPFKPYNYALRANDPFLENAIYESYSDAITLVRNDHDELPVQHVDIDNFASLSIGKSQLSVFQETLGKYAPFVHFVLPANDIDAEKLNELISKLSHFDQVVVGVHGPINNLLVKFLDLLDSETRLTSSVFNNVTKDDIDRIPGNLYVGYQNNDMTEQLVPQMIFGARPTSGMYPYPNESGQFYGVQTSATGRLAYGVGWGAGIDPSSLSSIDQIALEAINANATPGCQVLVAKKGKVVYERSFGTYSNDRRIPVQNQSIYDVASITKVAATTQVIMFLADQGAIDLNDSLSTYLPELKGTNKGQLVIRDVLTHQAGLKAFLPIWQNTLEFRHTGLDLYSDVLDQQDSYEVGFGMYATQSLKDSIWQWTVDSDLRKKENGRYAYRYSDLGFFLLQKLAEKVVNQPFDEFLDQNLYDPLGMYSTTFNPLCKFPITNLIPTEDDKDFRQSIVWGTVHDEIAAMNGGVAGHAGLFSTATDLAKLGQMHLQGGYYGGSQYFSSAIINEFTKYQGYNSRRGYGWDKPDRDGGYNPASEYASPKAFGHRGFTGTVLWVDPEFDLIYVFLSNRIHPDASNNKLNKLKVRRRIHDAIYESIFKHEQYIN